MTNVEAIYTRFEAFEEQLAHCYFLLHERFSANASLANFWLDGAMEELRHCSILRFCRKRSLTVVDLDVDSESMGHVADLLETIKHIVTNPNVTVDEAFHAAALLMESSQFDEIYEKLTRALKKDHLLLYQAVLAQLHNHFKNFTGWRRGIYGRQRTRGGVQGFPQNGERQADERKVS